MDIILLKIGDRVQWDNEPWGEVFYNEEDGDRKITILKHYGGLIELEKTKLTLI